MPPYTAIPLSQDPNSRNRITFPLHLDVDLVKLASALYSGSIGNPQGNMQVIVINHDGVENVPKYSFSVVATKISAEMLILLECDVLGSENFRQVSHAEVCHLSLPSWFFLAISVTYFQFSVSHLPFSA